MPANHPRRLRDVGDVEGYVRGTVAGLPASPQAREVLHAHGVRAVFRLERALPPEAALRPVLDAVLPVRLAAVERRLAGDAELLAA